MNPPGPLSRRQIEVLEMIRRGVPNRAIAAALKISEATAKNHVSMILERLEVDDRAAAVGRGFDLGILQPQDDRPAAPAAPKKLMGEASSVARRGFTLVELLVVIAIIGVLIGMLLPAIQSAREAGRRSACGNKMRQLGLALEQFNSANSHYPAGAVNLHSPAASPRINVWLQTLPYVEQGALFGQLDMKFAGGAIWNAGPYVALLSAGQPLMLCPSDGYGGTHTPGPGGLPRNNYFAFVNGRNAGDLSYPIASLTPTSPAPVRTIWAMFDNIRVTRPAHISDGTSKTMSFSEGLTGGPQEYRGFAWSDQPCGAFCNAWDPPNSLMPDKCWNAVEPGSAIGWCVRSNVPPRPAIASPAPGRDDSCVARSMHPGGVLTAFADASVRFVSDSVAMPVWQAGGTIAGGEVTGPME